MGKFLISNLKFKISNYYRGYTFVELVVVLSILITLIGLIAINLLQARQNVSVNTTVDTLVTDIRAQQVKAITGETTGTGKADSYGIRFEEESYILFKGSSYVPSDPLNQTIQIDDSLEFTTTGVSMIFVKPHGELSGTNSATLYDNSGKTQKVINLNSLGVVTSVN